MPGKIDDWVSNNYKWLLAVLAGAIAIYVQHKIMQHQVDTNTRRLQKYIDRHNASNETIHDLELRVTVLETTPND